MEIWFKYKCKRCYKKKLEEYDGNVYQRGSGETGRGDNSDTGSNGRHESSHGGSGGEADGSLGFRDDRSVYKSGSESTNVTRSELGIGDGVRKDKNPVRRLFG